MTVAPHPRGDEVAYPALEAGWHRAWVVETDPHWVLLHDDDERACRAGAGPAKGHGCQRRAVAAYGRDEVRRGLLVTVWWPYCDQHLYGRKLEHGRLLRYSRVRDEATA